MVSKSKSSNFPQKLYFYWQDVVVPVLTLKCDTRGGFVLFVIHVKSPIYMSFGGREKREYRSWVCMYIVIHKVVYININSDAQRYNLYV